MTTPPLPDVPCLRVRLDYTQTDGYLAGSRFFLSYAGSPPTAGNCSTIAGDIAAAWASHLAPVVDSKFALTEIDVIDIATLYGSSGQWTGSEAGGQTDQSLPAQSATNIEFDIARRYRGGKPRMFLPPGTVSDQEDAGHWTTTYIDNVNTGMDAFFAEIEALSVGAVGALDHVNLSYYFGFTNVTNSSGRTSARPKYRSPVAIHDEVNGYSCKGLIGSQRRRRKSTTF